MSQILSELPVVFDNHPHAFVLSFSSKEVGQARQLKIVRSRENLILKRYLPKKSKSAGVKYCVPDIHCIFEIVGRGGISAAGLKSSSFETVLYTSWR